MNEAKVFPDKNKFYRRNPVGNSYTVVKATNSVCNLACEYCYACKPNSVGVNEEPNRMSDEMLDSFIKQYVEQHDGDEIVFSWQGGEPLLLGIDFFKQVVVLQNKYVPSHKHCENLLKTNGVLLNDEWCEFFSKHDFCINFRIDGPAELNDSYRVYNNKQGSFTDAFNAATMLNKYGIRFATLSAVNNNNAKQPLEVYRFLRDEVKSKQIHFYPVVKTKHETGTAPRFWGAENVPAENSPMADPTHPDSFVASCCVGAEEYGDFWIAIFDEWYKNDRDSVSVPYFYSAIEQWVGQPSRLCIFSPICSKELALEYDGTLYTCDRYMYPEYQLGNINDFSLSELFSSPRQEHFAFAKDFMLPTKCRLCPFLFACEGGCPTHHLLKTEQGETGLNYLCKGLFKYFDYINPYIREIAHSLGYEVSSIVPAVDREENDG